MPKSEELILLWSVDSSRDHCPSHCIAIYRIAVFLRNFFCIAKHARCKEKKANQNTKQLSNRVAVIISNYSCHKDTTSFCSVSGTLCPVSNNKISTITATRKLLRSFSNPVFLQKIIRASLLRPRGGRGSGRPNGSPNRSKKFTNIGQLCDPKNNRGKRSKILLLRWISGSTPPLGLYTMYVPSSGAKESNFQFRYRWLNVAIVIMYAGIYFPGITSVSGTVCYLVF